MALVEGSALGDRFVKAIEGPDHKFGLLSPEAIHRVYEAAHEISTGLPKDLGEVSNEDLLTLETKLRDSHTKVLHEIRLRLLTRET